MRLRPHHIYCFYFMDFSDPSRGRDYEEAVRKVESLFKAGKGNIEVQEGPDFLCEACPYFNGQACSHPRGDEKEVKKWDMQILKGLGLEFGEVVKIEALRTLIKEKTPLNFCLTKCSYYQGNRCNSKDFRTPQMN